MKQKRTKEIERLEAEVKAVVRRNGGDEGYLRRLLAYALALEREMKR